MRVEIWSDIICPWCYIGKRRFEIALKQYSLSENVTVIWRSFELDPNAPQEYQGTLDEMLSKKYLLSLSQAAQMSAHVTALAKEVGLDYKLSDTRPGNTFDAHRLLHFAATHGLGERATERMMHAYFNRSLPVGDRSALVHLAPQFDIAETEAYALLEGTAYTIEVRADESRAMKLSISGVPYFLFNGTFGIAGAQPVEVFTDALHRTIDQPMDLDKFPA